MADLEGLLQMIEATGAKPRTTFTLVARPEPDLDLARPSVKPAIPEGLLLPAIQPSVINRLARQSLASRRK